VDDSVIEGDTIRWKVHGAYCAGTVSADGRRITNLKVTHNDEVVATFNGVWQEDLPKEQLTVWTSQNTEDTGTAGDRYRIQLRISGRWRAVTWLKLGEGADAVETLEDGSSPELPQAIAPAGPVEDVGSYYVVGGWNCWSFQDKMLKDDSAPGTHYLEAKMIWEGGDFQIVRDCDWSQSMHPAFAGALDGNTLEGPDDYSHGLNFHLGATPGDVFRIEFTRVFEDGQETRKVSWTLLRNEPLTSEEVRDAKSSSYYLVGTMETGREQRMKMQFDKERFMYVAQFEIGKSGEDYFAILWNGDWFHRIYPNLPDAYPGEGCPHTLVGPDDRGGDRCWKISEVSGDEDAAGETYEIQLHLSDFGQPMKVEWTRL